MMRELSPEFFEGLTTEQREALSIDLEPLAVDTEDNIVDRIVLIGTQHFEMSRMCYRDLAKLNKTVAVLSASVGTIIERAANDSVGLREAIAHYVTKGEFVEEILVTLAGCPKEALDKATAAQVLAAVAKWFQLNFFSMPEEAKEIWYTIFDLLNGIITSVLSSMIGGAVQAELAKDQIEAILDVQNETESETPETT